MKKFRNLFFVLLSFSLVLSGCSTSNENASQTTEIFTYGDEEKAYVAQVEENSAYGLDITQRLLENKSNEHGYRTAGSQAEFEAGEMLVKEFESIGLQNVHKDAFTTDGWEYREGEITFTSAENESYTAVLGGHAVQFQADNETYEVVYANRGTADDLAMLLNGGLHISFRRHVRAQVDDLKPLAFHHHFHQVFADIMQVAFYRADAHFPGRSIFPVRQQGL